MKVRSVTWAFALVALFFAAAVQSESRQLTPFFEQESVLAYSGLADTRSADGITRMVRVRDDNFRFVDIDPSFGMRNILAVWFLSEWTRGRTDGPLCPPPEEPDTRILKTGSTGQRIRILEILSREAKKAASRIPGGAAYRMPVLIIGDKGGNELKEPLAFLAGELPVSRRATVRWNDRLPLYGPDVAEVAIPPYVISSGEGKRISFAQIIITRELADTIARHLEPFRYATRALSPQERAALRRGITPENLTDVLLAMAAGGEL